MKKRDIRVIVHNVRSSYNVGSIFRTADACGVSCIYLSGYTPTPLDKFGKPNMEITKTALGADKSIPWQKENVSSLIKKLQKEEFEVIAIEQDKNSVNYKKIKIKDKTVFIVGNEVRGLSREVLNKCDKIAEIEMRGKKESLNVSVAFGVVLFYY